MKKYSSYKDSGVEWLGEIPSHWKVLHLRNLIRIFSEKGFPNAQLLSVTREKGVILRNKDDKEENHNFVPDDLSGYKHLLPGDFIINKMKSWQGSYGVSPYEGIVSPAYYTCKLKGVDKDFFSKAIRSKAYIPFFSQFSKGIRVDQWDLDPSAMKNIPFVLPSNKEQRAIASYISQITEHIDQAIAQQQKMIDLLNERKQIIIQKAVTKGLNPNAEMKDSGIEWIGEIPKNWNLYPLKRTVLLITAKRSTSDSNFNVSLENIESWSGKYVKTDSKYEGEGVAFTKDDILFGKLRPYLAKVLLADKDGIALGDFYVLRPTKFLPSYLKYVMLSKGLIYYIDSSTYGTKMPRANWSFIGSCSVPVPSKKQQYDIASYLDERLANIDNLVLKAQEIISLLQERKQIIINNVVTGKVKVC